jgi:hypothetical protein
MTQRKNTGYQDETRFEGYENRGFEEGSVCVFAGETLGGMRVRFTFAAVSGGI